MGHPDRIGVHPNGDGWVSAINKALVLDNKVWVGYTALAGDQQVETRPLKDKDGRTHRQVHGGPHRAVYVLPATSRRVWYDALGPKDDRGRDITAGYIGANLEIEGADEESIRIGDIWYWSGAELEVTGPRTPCKTLAMHTGVVGIEKMMLDNGRCGLYLGVKKVGWAPTTGTIEVVPGNGQSIADRFRRKKEEKEGAKALQLPGITA